MKGRSLLVKASTDGSTWYTVANLNEASMSNGAENIDITTFTKSYINRLQGLKDVTYSLSGFYDSTDTNGQVALRSAWENDSTIYIGFLPDGTAGWEQVVKVSSFEISGSVDGAVELSIELEGNDAIAAYSS